MASTCALSFRVVQRRPRGWEAAYMEHIYFTYISLWEGFFIVGLIDLRAWPLLILAVGIGPVVVGANRFSKHKAEILASGAELGRQSAA